MKTMKIRSRPRLIKFAHVILPCLLLSTGAMAYDPLETHDTFENAPPAEAWKEQKAQIPDHFNADDLQEFVPSESDHRFRYYIERGSLKTGDDWVTRFTVVIRSNKGAVNSSYEGLRCGHRQYRIYAYGDGKGLTPVTGTRWQTIPRTTDDYHRMLYEDLICNMQTGLPNPPETVFRAMQKGRRVGTQFFNDDR